MASDSNFLNTSDISDDEGIFDHDGELLSVFRFYLEGVLLTPVSLFGLVGKLYKCFSSLANKLSNSLKPFLSDKIQILPNAFYKLV